MTDSTPLLPAGTVPDVAVPKVVFDPNVTIPVDETAHPFAIPLSELQSKYESKKLVVGVAIVLRSSDPESQSGTTPKLLIVRRSPHEDIYPSMYEIPGGKAEHDIDSSLIMTVIRETKEETGLDVTRIIGVFDGFEYTTRKGVSTQLNFLVEVAGEGEPKVVLHPAEHDHYAWVGPGDDLEQYEMTESMIKVVKDALYVMAKL